MDTRMAVSLSETYLALIDANTPRHVVDAYVRLTAEYGVSAERISEVSGVPLNRVALILDGYKSGGDHDRMVQGR